MTSLVVAVGVADIRREPDANAELVTQALLNVPAIPGAVSGEWTHVTLPDYAGWIHSAHLADPITKGFCKVGEHCATPLPLVAVVNVPHTTLYGEAQEGHLLGPAYLSTQLPLLDTTHTRRVQAALPAEQTAWLDRSAITIQQDSDPYPRQPLSTILNYAALFLGVPYLWGGTTFAGIDCSGFVQLCYRMGGYIIPRDGDQQYDFLSTSIPRTQIAAGDLIFFGAKSITHVALALNAHEYIHAEGQNYGRVLISSFRSSDPHYYPRLDEIMWGVKRVVS